MESVGKTMSSTTYLGMNAHTVYTTYQQGDDWRIIYRYCTHTVVNSNHRASYKWETATLYDVSLQQF